MLQRDDKLVPLELRIENILLCYRLCNSPLFVVATSNKTSPHQMEKEKNQRAIFIKNSKSVWALEAAGNHSMLNQFLQCDEVMNFSLYEIVRQ